MDDFDKPGDHGTIRSDFPGGWDGDSVNAFTGEGLDEQSKEMQNFVRKLMNYRKSSKAIHKGKTMHFSPVDGTYLLTRSFKDETVVLLLNKNDTPITLDLEESIWEKALETPIGIRPLRARRNPVSRLTIRSVHNKKKNSN